MLFTTKGKQGGTDVDSNNIYKTFHDILKFAVFRIENPPCAELACLVQAAADFKDYPEKYSFIAFYYAGHGGKV